MKRIARIMWKGTGRWVDCRNTREFRLLSGDPFHEELREESWDGMKFLEDAEALNFLPPCDASKVIGLGYNYKSLVGIRKHYDEPVFFMKSPTSVCGHRAKIRYPDFASNVWVEGELAVVIKKRCHNVGVNEARDLILGFTIGSDITAENIHGRDWHLARSKAIDGFAPLGPFLVDGVDTTHLQIRTLINGKEFQRGNTSDRIWNDCETVSHISHYLTLMPGDVILTGTPAGARESTVRRGDEICHQIENIGELSFQLI